MGRYVTSFSSCCSIFVLLDVRTTDLPFRNEEESNKYSTDVNVPFRVYSCALFALKFVTHKTTLLQISPRWCKDLSRFVEWNIKYAQYSWETHKRRHFLVRNKRKSKKPQLFWKVTYKLCTCFMYSRHTYVRISVPFTFRFITISRHWIVHTWISYDHFWNSFIQLVNFGFLKRAISHILVQLRNIISNLILHMNFTLSLVFFF